MSLSKDSYETDTETKSHGSSNKFSKLQTLVEVLKCELGRPRRSPGSDAAIEPTKQWTPLHYAVYHNRQAALLHFLRGQPPDESSTAQPLLCLAVTAGHHGAVSMLCEAGASINTGIDETGETALHLALKAERIDIFEILMRYKPDVDARALHTHATPLHYAASKPVCAVAITALLHQGADIGALNVHGSSPGEVALQSQNLDAAIKIIRTAGTQPHRLVKEKQLLLEQVLKSRGRSPLNRDLVAEAFQLACPPESSPLVEAIKTGDADVVKLVLEKTSSANKATMSGLLPIFAALDASSAPVVRALVEHGADVTLRNTHGLNVLQAVLENPRLRDKETIAELFELFLSRGADARSALPNGSTLLHRIIGESIGTKLVQLLLRHGVSVDARDRNGNTALHLAATSPICVTLLLKHGSDANAVNGMGLTPLLGAIKSAAKDREPDLRELIRSSDRRKTNSAGKTALHLAAQNGLTRTVKSLLEAHAETTSTDSRKRTPLLIAVHNYQWEIVPMLATLPGSNAWDENGLTALHHIAMSSPKESYTWKDIARAASCFCEKGVSRSMRDHSGSTPLIQAVKALPVKGLPVVEALLFQKGSERGNCVAHEDHDERNALYYAATSGKVPFVEALLRHGSPFDLREWRPEEGPLQPSSEANKRILRCFAECEWTRRMSRLYRQPNNTKDGVPLPKALPVEDLNDLLTMGLDPNRLPVARFPNSLIWALLDRSPLTPEFLSGYFHDALKVILSFGADSNAMICRKRSSSRTPLAAHALTHILEQCPEISIDMVRLLLEAGASTSIASSLYEDRYPLHSAVRTNRVEVVEDILLRGSDVNCRDGKQRTPLFFAAESESPRLVDILLHARAEVDLVDVDGNTTLHTAATAGCTEVISRLLSGGAKASIENRKGLVPLDCISEHLSEDRKHEITTLLEQAQNTERRRLSPPPLNSRGRASPQGAGSEKAAVKEARKLSRKPGTSPAPSTTFSQGPIITPTPTNVITPPHIPAKDEPAPLRLSKQLIGIRFTPPTPPTFPPTVAPPPPPPPPAPVNETEKPSQTPRIDSGLDLSKAGEQRAPPVLERHKATFDDVPGEDDELKSWLSMSKMLETL